MKNPLVGFVGWRGMVGSVLMKRMQEEKDFQLIEPIFFSMHNLSSEALPEIVKNKTVYLSDDITALRRCNIIITCQGSTYTQNIYPKLRSIGWNGHWIDAASTLRLSNKSVIILDPINRKIIDQAIFSDGNLWIGGNCTVSLMLMSLHGLFKEKLIEWIHVTTYQAASGAGSQNVRELLLQMGELHNAVKKDLITSNISILEIDEKLSQVTKSADFPAKYFRKIPLAGNLIPWIDTEEKFGQTKEEWKGHVECNKILGLSPQNLNHIIIDGVCVRVGTIRSHAQALNIKLKKNLSITEIENILNYANEWVKVIPNEREATENELTPMNVSGTLNLLIGRLRKLAMGPNYLSAFIVGDQLLWGAAEPLRRMLRILLEHKK